MAWTTAGTGDSIVWTKGSVWVSRSEYDKLKQKLENCEEQNQRFRKEIGELKEKLADKLNPVERIGYDYAGGDGTYEFYQSHDGLKRIEVNMTLLLAGFYLNDEESNPTEATVSEMKAVVEYLEGEDKWKK